MKKIILVSTILLIFNFSCRKVCCYVPLEYQFTIVNSEGNSYFTQKPVVKLYTLEGGNKRYNDYFVTRESLDPGAPYKFAWSISYKSGDTFKQTFYLELPGGDIDTLYLNVGNNEFGTAFAENRFNGKIVEIDDQSMQNIRLHLLKK